MSSQSSTLFTVGTLLRHAQDAGAHVRILVSGVWLDGVIVGADGLGVILDDGDAHQALIRLDSIAAVKFSRSAIDGEQHEPADEGVRPHAGSHRQPIEAGPVGAGV